MQVPDRSGEHDDIARGKETFQNEFFHDASWAWLRELLLLIWDHDPNFLSDLRNDGQRF